MTKIKSIKPETRAMNPIHSHSQFPFLMNHLVDAVTVFVGDQLNNQEKKPATADRPVTFDYQKPPPRDTMIPTLRIG